MITYSPGQWSAFMETLGSVPADDRCVNEGAVRGDGTFCAERAEANGWCRACWASIDPKAAS